MKKTVITVFMLFICFVVVSAVDARGPYRQGGGDGYNYCPYCGTDLRSDDGYGRGSGMMWRHWDDDYDERGPGMMRRYWRDGAGQSGECQKFLNDTVEMRKELQLKKFEYFEALRNPETTDAIKDKLEKELDDLQGKIAAKAPRGCRLSR